MSTQNLVANTPDLEEPVTSATDVSQTEEETTDIEIEEKGSGMKMPLIIGGAVLAIVGIVLVILFACTDICKANDSSTNGEKDNKPDWGVVKYDELDTKELDFGFKGKTGDVNFKAKWTTMLASDSAQKFADDKFNGENIKKAFKKIVKAASDMATNMKAGVEAKFKSWSEDVKVAEYFVTVKDEDTKKLEIVKGLLDTYLAATATDAATKKTLFEDAVVAAMTDITDDAAVAAKTALTEAIEYREKMSKFSKEVEAPTNKAQVATTLQALLGETGTIAEADVIITPHTTDKTVELTVTLNLIQEKVQGVEAEAFAVDAAAAKYTFAEDWLQADNDAINAQVQEFGRNVVEPAEEAEKGAQRIFVVLKKFADDLTKPNADSVKVFNGITAVAYTPMPDGLATFEGKVEAKFTVNAAAEKTTEEPSDKRTETEKLIGLPEAAAPAESTDTA